MNPDGFEYHGYILRYVDYMIFTPDHKGKYMNMIQKDFNLKYDKIDNPGMYLGATVSNISLEGGKMGWKMSDENYAKASVTNVGYSLDRYERRLPSACVTTLYSDRIQESLWNKVFYMNQLYFQTIKVNI